MTFLMTIAGFLSGMFIGFVLATAMWRAAGLRGEPIETRRARYWVTIEESET